jgi:hypothetical protein
MSSHRVSIVALAAVFMVAMTSLASACCTPVVSGETNSPNPIPLAPAPIYVGPWSNSWSDNPRSFGPSLVASGGCGCCGCGAAPSPLYVVDQGPTYTGAGVMVPFLTYTPATSYPYVSGCCGSDPGVAPPRQSPPLVRKAPALH